MDAESQQASAEKTRTAQSPRSGRSAVRATERSEVNTTTEDQGFRFIKKPLFRRKGRSVDFDVKPPPGRLEPVRRPAKVAQQLALAHHLHDAVERGEVANRATLARRLGLTRARVTQFFDLLMLAADLQEQVLRLEAVDGWEPMSEKTLRAVAHAGTWAEQREAWAKLPPCATQGR